MLVFLCVQCYTRGVLYRSTPYSSVGMKNSKTFVVAQAFFFLPKKKGGKPCLDFLWEFEGGEN